MFCLFKANLEDKQQFRLHKQGSETQIPWAKHARSQDHSSECLLKRIFLDNSCCPSKRKHFEQITEEWAEANICVSQYHTNIYFVFLSIFFFSLEYEQGFKGWSWHCQRLLYIVLQLYQVVLTIRYEIYLWENKQINKPLIYSQNKQTNKNNRSLEGKVFFYRAYMIFFYFYYFFSFRLSPVSSTNSWRITLQSFILYPSDWNIPIFIFFTKSLAICFSLPLVTF